MNENTPIDDERAAIIAELRWLADARENYQTDTFPSIAREVQTSRHLADILERKAPVAEGGAGFGWIPSWLWDEWDQMGLRRSEVPEPSALPDYFAPKPMPKVTFEDRLSARSDYELGRMAGRDEIRAEQEDRKKSGVWVEHAGHCNAAPQGEPSDAQVLAALNSYEPWSAEESLDAWGSDQAERMRAALRAARGVR